MLRTLLRCALCCAVALAAASASAQWLVPAGASLDVPAGSTVDFACTSLDMQGTLNLDGGTLTTDSSVSFAATSSLIGAGGTISVGGDVISASPINAPSSTLILRDGCNAGNTTQLSGNIIVQNLVLQSTTGRLFTLPAGANITVLGTLTIQGTPGQPVQLASAGGASVINLGPAATVVQNFAAIPPNVQIGLVAVAAAPIPTLSTYALMLLSLIVAGFAARNSPGVRKALRP